MSKLNLSKIPKVIAGGVKKKSPELFIFASVVAFGCTVVLAVKETPTALKLIEDKKREINRELLEEAAANGKDKCDRIDKLTPIDTVKVAWKCYIPAAAMGGLSIACLLNANRINARRGAALAAAYTLSESTLKEYKDKVIETVGEKKEKDIRDAVVKDKLEKDPVDNKEIIITDKGEALCYDALSGRYFKSSIESLNKAVNELNHRLIYDTYISLNDYYGEIGLEEIKIGYDLGWRVDRGLIELDFSYQPASDGSPCMAIDFLEPPKYDFDKSF